MLLISPVDNLAETEALLEAGADELYGGYLSPAWEERFSLLASINQRTFAGAQIDSCQELAAIVRLAHQSGRRFLLTLNAPFYTEQQLPLLDDYVAEALDAGIDGLILADLGLARRLHRQWPDLQLHASTLAHLGNRRAAELYLAQGFSSIIFPRHLTVAEMATMAGELPEVRCDAFLLVGKCPNTEGFCSFHHSRPDKIWPCEIPYQIEALHGDGSDMLHQAMQRQGSWSRSNRRHGCGLCAIPGLLQAGIGGLKLVGRGAPTAQKIANLTFAGQFLQLARDSDNLATYRRAARAAFCDRFGSRCSPNVCYYPEFYTAE